MAFSLLPDLMGCRQKLQLALSDYRSDTGCIEMPAEFDGLSAAKRHDCSQTIVDPTGQQKAPDRSGAFRNSGVCFRATSAPQTARHQYR